MVCNNLVRSDKSFTGKNVLTHVQTSSYILTCEFKCMDVDILSSFIYLTMGRLNVYFFVFFSLEKENKWATFDEEMTPPPLPAVTYPDDHEYHTPRPTPTPRKRPPVPKPYAATKSEKEKEDRQQHQQQSAPTDGTFTL